MSTPTTIQIGNLHTLLKEACTSTDSASQKQVYKQMSAAEDSPHFYLALVGIAADSQVQNSVRIMALVCMRAALKRNMETIEFGDEQLKFIRMSIINLKYGANDGMGPAHKNLISMIALWGKRIDFEILAYLLSQIGSGDVSRCEWSLSTLKVILEDLRFESENINCFQKPQFLQFLSSYISTFSRQISQPTPTTTQPLLQCMNLLIRHIIPLPTSTSIINQYLHVFLVPIISNISNNFSVEIVCVALDGITEVLEINAKAVMGDQVVLSAIFGVTVYDGQLERLFQLTKKWLSLVFDLLDKGDDGGLNMTKYFPVLLPKVIANLEFTKEDQLNVQIEMEEENNPYDYDDDEEQSNKQQQGFLNYTRRKLGVFILNELFTHYCEEIWPIVHPILQTFLNSENQVQKQIGALMVGIIYSLMQDHLQFLSSAIPQIVNKINNTMHPDILRCTSLWAISKIAYLIIREPELNSQIQKELMMCLSSSSGQVKEAAFSALDEFIRLDEALPANLGQIAMITLEGIRVYQAKPLYNSLRICSTLYQKHSDQIPNDITQAMLKQLCLKWGQNSNSESVMSPILQCLVTISSANTPVFQKYAAEIFNQTFSILQNENQKAIILRSLDLLSSIVMMQLPQISSILQQSAQFHNKLHSLLVSQQNQIRNFSYGLLGDITKSSRFPQFAQTYIQTIGSTIKETSLTACSNALTCLTDILVAHPQFVGRYCGSVMALAVKKMAINNLERVYGFNFARVFGRLANLCPAEGVPYLSNSLQNICRFLKANQHHRLTDDAYKGILKLIQLNPEAAANNFEYLVQAFLCYSCQDQEAHTMFISLLKSYRGSQSAENWNSFLQKPIFLPAVAKKIDLISS